MKRQREATIPAVPTELPPPLVLMAGLSEPGVGADLAQLVCQHGLLTLDRDTSQTWWTMQGVNHHWKSAFDAAWPGVQRGLDALMADVQTVYDAWNPAHRIVFPPHLARLEPRQPGKYFKMHLYRPIFLKWATLRFPATVPAPELLEKLGTISDSEWPASSLLSVPCSPVDDIGTLTEHHALPMIARIFSISFRCAERTTETLLYTLSTPARESVPFMLLFTLLTSLNNPYCVIFDRFFNPVATVAGYDKLHNRVPDLACMEWSDWPACAKQCRKTLFDCLY